MPVKHSMEEGMLGLVWLDGEGLTRSWLGITLLLIPCWLGVLVPITKWLGMFVLLSI